MATAGVEKHVVLRLSLDEASALRDALMALPEDHPTDPIYKALFAVAGDDD